jgi:hypothetical protein
MMPKKTCNCPNKPKVQLQEDLDQAYKIYLQFKKLISLDFLLELKIKLKFDKEELSFLDKDNKIIFNI